MRRYVPSMQVAALWRYPVKSFQGEPREELAVAPGGVIGDRSFGVLDAGTRTILSAKRDPRLLGASARWLDDELRVVLPGGEELPQGDRLDAALTAWLGLQVGLVAAVAHGPGTFESHEDAEDDASALVRWRGIGGSFVDESHLHLVTTGDLDLLGAERPELQWDLRRFRPNVLVEGDAGVLTPGMHLHLGASEVEVVKGCTRCTMTTRPQPGGLQGQPEVLRHVVAAHANIVGVRARVVRGGWLRLGDPVGPATTSLQAGASTRVRS